MFAGIYVDGERSERVPEPAELPAPHQDLQEGALVQDHGRGAERRPGPPEPAVGPGKNAQIPPTHPTHTTITHAAHVFSLQIREIRSGWFCFYPLCRFIKIAYSLIFFIFSSFLVWPFKIKPQKKISGDLSGNRHQY